MQVTDEVAQLNERLTEFAHFPKLHWDALREQLPLRQCCLTVLTLVSLKTLYDVFVSLDLSNKHLQKYR